MPLKCSPFSLRFLFLFAQGEDSYSFSRACPSGSSCLSGHHPSPTSGWALSCLCSRTNPPLSPWRRALRPQDFGQYPGPGRRGESMWSQVPRGNSFTAATHTSNKSRHSFLLWLYPTFFFNYKHTVGVSVPFKHCRQSTAPNQKVKIFVIGLPWWRIG